MNNKKHFIYIFLCVNIFALCSCGVKPAYVDPPESSKEDSFPRTYPDISTDPKYMSDSKEL